MASVTRNNLGPTVTLYTKEDFGVVFGAFDYYLNQVTRTERRYSKFVYHELRGQRSKDGGFSTCYPTEFSGEHAMATIRAVGSFTRHEILEGDSHLERLGSRYAQMIGVGLEMIHQAVEARYDGIEYEIFKDFNIANLAS
jgi:hypothetical protein